MSKISEHYSEIHIKTIGLDREQHHKRRSEKRVQSFLRPPEIGEYERKTLDKAPRARKPSGRLWKRIADQVGRNYLEWVHWGKFLIIWEFSVAKNDGHKDRILTIEDGKLKTANGRML